MSPWIKSLSLAASVFSCLPDTVYAVPSPHYVIKSVSNLERRQSNATTDAIENIIDALKAADFDDDWRSATCENKGVVDHTMYGPDRWEEVDAGGAWEAVLEGWKLNLTEGRVEKNFANNVSNYFHGPQDMFCEIFSDEGSGCEDLHLQCNSVNFPAGYFILHSFENLFAMHSNIWAAVGDAVLNNDIAGIAADFGKIPKKEQGVAISILIDIAMIAWGLVMGPSWNKLIGPKFSDSSTASTVKDTTNDIVKNSLTLTKDIFNSRAADQLGVQNGLEAQMQAITQVWKDSVLETQKWLFGGSDEGNAQLGSLISDASMFGDGWLLDRAEHSKEVKRSLNAFMIPLAWSYSPDGLFPFIADAGVPCGEDPGWNDNYQYWIEESAQGNGFCHEGNSYWLLTGRDSNTQCNSVTGDVWCGKFDSPPGYQQLVDKTYSDISLDNVVIGSINTKNANGKNGGPKADMEAPGKEVLESFVASGLEAPGIWNIPICSMEEVLENYYVSYDGWKDDMTNFPCNP